MRETGRPPEADPIVAPEWCDWRIVRDAETGGYLARVRDTRTGLVGKTFHHSWPAAVAWVRGWAASR